MAMIQAVTRPDVSFNNANGRLINGKRQQQQIIEKRNSPVLISHTTNSVATNFISSAGQSKFQSSGSSRVLTSKSLVSVVMKPSESEKSAEEATTSSASESPIPEITLTEITPTESVRPLVEALPLKCSSELSPPVSRRRRSKTRVSSEVVVDLKDSSFRLNQYLVKEHIGSGSTSKVFIAENEEDGRKYALKILSKKKLSKHAGWFGKAHLARKMFSPLEKAYKEISILKKMDHPNIVKLVEVLDNKADDGLYLVFELVEKGEVMKVPSSTPFSENQARSYFRDAVLGLEYLHHQKIIHRDIKPQNLLVAEDGTIQIADLGVCSEFEGDQTKMRQSAATPAFTPPEALDSKFMTYCGKALDVWCLGCTLYAFVFGDLPFGSTGSIAEMYEKIKVKSVNLEREPPLSKPLHDLLSKMLTRDPSQRITLPEIKVHDWVTCNGSMPLPTEEENCALIVVSPEEIENAVKLIPKLDTLILLKIMLRHRSFQNPLTVAHGASIVQPDSDVSRSSSNSGSSCERKAPEGTGKDDEKCKSAETTEL